jgi:hypothetical protein
MGQPNPGSGGRGCYRARLSTVDDATLDSVPDGGGWTLRQVVHHVSHVTAYADMLSQ